MGAVIGLLTDFGIADTYVGVMKAVIASIAPGTSVIDITHAIRPQDVAHGAYALLVSVPYFPAGSVVVAVVDPGVGSARRMVALRVGGHTLVGPDNGLFSYLLERHSVDAAVALAEPRYRLPTISATFHGRDIFAPAAAHLVGGLALDALGPPVAPASLVRLPSLGVKQTQDGWEGRIIHIDHFGNAIASLAREQLGDEAPEGWHIEIGGTTIAGLSRTFAEVAPGAPVAYLGSDGFLECAIRNGHGAHAFGVAVGDPIRCTWGGGSDKRVEHDE